MSRSEFETRLFSLLEQLANDTISSNEHQELQGLLRDNPDAREAYFEFVDLHAGLREWSALTVLNGAVDKIDGIGVSDEDGAVQASRLKDSKSVLQDSMSPNGKDISHRHRWLQGLATIAIAASLLIGIGLLMWQKPGDPVEELAVTNLPAEIHPVAFISQSVGSYDPSGNAWKIGSEIASGAFDIERGVVLLTFQSGAEVAVEGPAALSIVDSMHVRLDHGIITVNVPASAIGFTVDTDSARVVDLGTSFGVSVGLDSETEVCVFAGEVEVNHREDVDAEPLSVIGGQSVRATTETATVENVEYQTAAFERAWPISSGVLQTTGNMKFVSPGPAFVPGRYKDDKQILVFAERENVLLAEPLQVDLREPGEYTALPSGKKPVLPTGTKLRSYLIQLDSPQNNPIGPDGLAEIQRVISQITFDAPIVGLIVTPDNRVITDELLGHPNGDYGGRIHAGGIEARSDFEGPGLDTVILAPGQRTLSLDLTVRWDIDQIRVLVEEVDSEGR